ncbi:MAG: type III pantothenate kinase [Candidatus Omnitrophica bacterium]|nr:type III pantothenate kinase [Candidatus Omnitrophota bacterium]
MLLAIDIGNTNISFGVFKGRGLAKRFNISTRDYKLAKLEARLAGLDIGQVVICSVVPQITGRLARDLKGLSGRRPYIIGKDILVPLKNLYRRPRQVGQDRLVNAYAGVRLYGAPLIVVDFGTAVTFDVVSKNKEYLGGMILPGLGISLEALAERTALLPRIKLGKPAEFIGRDTRASMLSGIVYGFAALSDDLALRIKEKIRQKALVIGTGGNINIIARYCRGLDKIDRDLTLKGLSLLENLKKSA